MGSHDVGIDWTAEQNVAYTAGLSRRGPAEVGEHSREVWMEARFTGEEVDALLASRALRQGARE